MDYDVIIIGTTEAGERAALASARKGKKVALVDNSLQETYSPLFISRIANYVREGYETADKIRRFNEIGIRLGSGQASWKEIVSSAKEQAGLIDQQEKTNLHDVGIEVYHGNTTFTDTQSIEVDGKMLSASVFLVAASSKPKPLDILGDEFVMSAEEFLLLETVPKRIIMLGGGLSSFELAHWAIRAGSEVMILNRSSRVLKEFDRDLVQIIEQASRDRGIIIKNNHPLIKLEKYGNSFVVFTQEEGREIRENADVIVHGAGKVPDLDRLHLKNAEVAYSDKGITVDTFLKSVSNAHVFAAGDSADTGSSSSAIGKYEGSVAAYNLFHKTKRRRMDYTFIPSTVFSIPHLAKAGYGEEQAIRKGLKYTVHFKRIEKSYTAHKLLIQKKTNRIIGAHAVGEHADELVNFLSFAMQHKMTIEDIQKPLYSYSNVVSHVVSMV
jgi:glutathione reductase (NADPH)